MDKLYLRNKYLKVRNNIADKKEISRKTFQLVEKLDIYKKSKIIALFSSMQNEIDTTSFAIDCLKDHKKICYPKSYEDGAMEFYFVDDLDKLVNVGSFKIKEPVKDKDTLVNKNDIDLMVLPGIVFDTFKNRVGFGKGYYDRYLLNNKNIYKLGVTFDDLIVKNGEIDVNKNDVKVDMILSLHNEIK